MVPTFQIGVWSFVRLLAQFISITSALTPSNLHVQVNLGNYLQIDWVVLTITYLATERYVQVSGPSYPTVQTESVTIQILY